MSDFHTFEDKTKQFKLSVKTEFLQKCPNPSEFNVFDLNSKFYLFKFLHNPTAPAVIRLLDDDKVKTWEDNSFYVDKQRIQYWLDGIYINKEDKEKAEKMHHAFLFNNKLQTVIE